MQSDNNSAFTAVRKAFVLSAIYFLLTFSYIVLSSTLAADSAQTVQQLLNTELLKGLFFSIVSSIISFVLFFIALQRLDKAYREVQLTNSQLQVELESKERLNQQLLSSKALVDEAQLVKNRFLATISHELRTPLHGILGMTEILADQPLGEDATERVRAIQSLTAGLLAIVNDLLDLATIASGKYKLSQVPFQLQTWWHDLEGFARFRCQEKSQDLQVHVHGQLNLAVLGDANRLRQAVLNVLENAAKFTPEGGVMQLHIETSAKNGAITLRIQVVDSGIGFPESEMERLFVPFTQLDNTDSRRHGGVGLGLSITRELLTTMGGKISATSEVGKGSTFTLEVVLPAADDSPSSDGLPMVRAAGGARALIVEDNEVNRRVAQAMMTKAGFETVIAVNGQEAVDQFLRTNYDVVLMDVQMPVMDGLEATKVIREYERTHRGEMVPILAMTARALPNDRELCLRAGMTDVITKPFSRTELLRLVREATSSRLWQR